MKKQYISTYTGFRMLLFLLTALALGSCKKNFLDVSDKLAPELTADKVFSDPTLTRQYYANIFSGIPNSSRMIIDDSYTAIGGLDNPWAAVSDEIKASSNNVKTIASNGYNPGNASLGRWVTLYQLIRQANVFMGKARAIPQTGISDFISEQEVARMKTVARFFRAYYHYLLFELYGPIPIMDKAADPNAANLDFARNSVDEVVKFISDELTAVVPGLDDMATRPEERTIPTKGIALAVKAKLLVYAASPLFNGGFPEALALKNTDGKQLFSPNDAGKWNVAKTALEEFLNFANGKYELFKLYTGSGGTYNPDESLYRLFMDVDGNKEVIWATPVTSWGNVSTSSAGTDRSATPRSERAGWCGLGITQELVDDFFMIDGLTIEESPLYNESSFSVAGDDPSGRTEPGTFKMWVNREPRFYQTVFFQDRRWPISNNKVQFHKGSGNDNSAQDNCYTGYLMHKRFARNVRNEGTYPRSQFRPAIVFRLAEFYLLYAEVCNEVNPADPKIFQYLDMVRERAGIPKLSLIKPAILGNQAQLREAIRLERRVELATEGQRYFDVRRWMIAEKSPGQGGQGGTITGMDMNSSGLTIGGYFKRTFVENRVFTKAMYLYPIPLDEIQKSKLLVQNPLW